MSLPKKSCCHQDDLANRREKQDSVGTQSTEPRAIWDHQKIAILVQHTLDIPMKLKYKKRTLNLKLELQKFMWVLENKPSSSARAVLILSC